MKDFVQGSLLASWFGAGAQCQGGYSRKRHHLRGESILLSQSLLSSPNVPKALSGRNGIPCLALTFTAPRGGGGGAGGGGSK